MHRGGGLNTVPQEREWFLQKENLKARCFIKDPEEDQQAVEMCST